MSAKSSEAFGEGSQHYETHDEIISVLTSSLQDLKDESVAILVKGSNSMKMFTIVEAMVKMKDL